jgi:hypothetical protein
LRQNAVYKLATETLGEKLKDMVKFPSASDAIEELKSFDDSYSKDLLLSLLSKASDPQCGFELGRA